MERNVQKNGLVNLIAAVMVFIAAFVTTTYVNSLAGQAASVFLGLAVLVAFASWFQMRLAENERLEKLEMDELARAKGDSTLFESKDAEVFPAHRARAQFEKYFVPGFGVLLFILQAGGAWLIWRWIAMANAGVAPERAIHSCFPRKSGSIPSLDSTNRSGLNTRSRHFRSSARIFSTASG